MARDSAKLRDLWSGAGGEAAVHSPVSRVGSGSTRSSTAVGGRGVWSFLDRAYGLDLRSLALFRICLGALIVCDLIWRARDLRAFYTDFGVLPRGALLGRFAGRWVFSLHMLSGERLVQALLFLVATGFGIMLLVGYRTKLATIASWLLLISVQNRDPFVLDNGDVLLRMLVFWAMFLPLNAHFSLDRLLDNSKADRPQRVFTGGSVALMAQVVLLYWFAVLWKSAPDWWTEGSAVYYTLSLEQLATPVGHFLLQFPALLTFLTFLTMAIEMWAPVFLLCPFMTGPVRTASIFLTLMLQLGLLICMHLGRFPLVAMAAVIGFIPTGFWSLVARRRSGQGGAGAPHSLSTYYDGWVAGHRPQVARLVGLFSRPLNLHTHWLTSVLAIFFLGYVFWWNLGTVGSRLAMPDGYRWIGVATRTDQSWAMFAPYPLRDDGWYVIPGVLRDGRQVDVFRAGAPVSFAKPTSSAIAGQYTDERWRNYLMNLYLPMSGDARFQYARYLCRTWNEARTANDPERLATLEIYFMMRSNVLWTQPQKAHEKHLLRRHRCT